MPVKKQKKMTSLKYSDETKVHPALRDYMGYCFFKASAKLRSLMDKRLQTYKLQSYHVGLLKVLEQSTSLSQIAIGDELGIDKASMVKLIDHLESNKFVLRKNDSVDRRVKNIELTQLGKKMILQCEAHRLEVEKEFFNKVSKSEIALIKKILPQLI